MNHKIPLLIDTDPGVDDALALLMAFNDQRHEVVGLTIAAGNVGLEHTVRNALKLCEVAGSSAPVFAGCEAPLLHPALDAAFVHGRDGFGDTGYAPATRAAEYSLRTCGSPRVEASSERASRSAAASAAATPSGSAG